jgi:hypothetical protein
LRGLQNVYFAWYARTGNIGNSNGDMGTTGYADTEYWKAGQQAIGSIVTDNKNSHGADNLIVPLTPVVIEFKFK